MLEETLRIWIGVPDPLERRTRFPYCEQGRVLLTLSCKNTKSASWADFVYRSTFKIFQMQGASEDQTER